MVSTPELDLSGTINVEQKVPSRAVVALLTHDPAKLIAIVADGIKPDPNTVTVVLG